jgi:CelD/BcsL family acetyltransferase involved in cellulose biosynthesis
VAEAELIVDLEALERLAPAWDALAVANAEPASGPAWMLAWWRHVAPRSAELRAVAVREDDQLVGILPFYVDPGRRGAARMYRLLASDYSASVTPLSQPDRAWDVAQAAAMLLARHELRPDLIELAPLSSASPWASALRERWPARMRPLQWRPYQHDAPTISLHDGSFDAWLGERSSRFRANVRRYRRLFEEAGGTYRYATSDTVEQDVRTFVALHHARWEGLGASRMVALGERLPAFLDELARGLVAQERFRLLMLELDGAAICADLWIAAGGESTGVNVGWDERHKRLSPPRLAFLHTIEDAFARGERRLNLGFGRVDYKQGYANGGDVVVWDELLIPGRTLVRALPRTVPRMLSRQVRTSVKRALTQEQADRLRAARDRLGLRADSR